MTTTVELAEAFGLGSALAKIDTTLDFVRTTVEKTDSTVTDMSTDVSMLKVEQGRQGEQIRTAFQRIEAAEAKLGAGTAVSRGEFDELKTEVRGARLSWPKLLAGAGGIAATIVVLTWIDGLTPGG